MATFGIALMHSFSIAKFRLAGGPSQTTYTKAKSRSAGSGSGMTTGLSTIIVPWMETIYYKRQQNGYHGGATPQEMICPLVILIGLKSGDERKAHPVSILANI